MPIIGVLHLELSIEHAQSLKDRRNVIRSLKARLRSRHNVAVAEIGPAGILNRALVSAVTISNDRTFAEKVLQAVEQDAADVLGGMLESSGVEWVE
ncbi:MAG: DUF503 domain-containing protein [Bryobacteraceae bacterium]